MIKNHTHIITASTLFTLIIGVYLFLIWNYPVTYIWATYEDLYGEWAQTYTYAIACLFCFVLAFMRSHYRWFFVLLSLACLYVVMEEISYGQRIIGFDTPELLKRHNLQREANLHNVFVGPVSTATRDIVEYVVAGGLFLFGVLYPLTLKFKWSVAQWFDRKGFAAPPFYLWPFFLVASWLETSPFNFNEAEIAEILVASALAIMSAHYWIILRRKLTIRDEANWPAGTSSRISAIIIAIVITVGILAPTTTQYFYSDPDQRARMNGRVLNGYEKFSKRYARYDRPELAVYLLEKVHQSEPERTTVLRRLARLHGTLGNDDKVRYYNEIALDIGLRKHAEKPDGRSTNISLAYTYRQLGNFEKASFHAARAHENALKKVETSPNSAHAAYWLAKTYRLRRDYPAAAKEYKRAFELKPTSTKYRRAYYSMRRRVAANKQTPEE